MFRVSRSALAVVVGLAFATGTYSETSVEKRDEIILPVDPTKPFSNSAAAATSKKVRRNLHQLQSILFSPQRSVAIVNGQPMGVGDRENGIEVISIDEKSVVIVSNGTTRRLKLRQIHKEAKP